MSAAQFQTHLATASRALAEANRDAVHVAQDEGVTTDLAMAFARLHLDVEALWRALEVHRRGGPLVVPGFNRERK